MNLPASYGLGPVLVLESSIMITSSRTTRNSEARKKLASLRNYVPRPP